MLKIRLFYILSALLSFFVCAHTNEPKPIVVATKRIVFPEFPDAHNPSIIKIDQGFILIFRYIPDLQNQPCTSYIGAVLLDDTFEQISSPQILNTRFPESKTPSQAEDARIFSYRGRLFLIYNDNLEVIAPTIRNRRDMFIAELTFQEGIFQLSPPLKLVCHDKYHKQYWQKNWVPFESKGKLFLSYSINPHEVLHPNLTNGSCYVCYDSQAALKWELGTLRGSTPAQLVDGEYLAFFHSGTITSSPSSWDQNIWHYFMGAYTFSATPPFAMTQMTPQPITAEGFYTQSSYYKRVIFPGGYVVSGPHIYLAYGKDDSEVWIATIDREALKTALKPVEELE